MNELSKLGLNPEVQKTVVVRESEGSPFHVGTVQNIVARLKGTDNSKAILLMGHYDTVPTSRGTSDDGSALAVILETLRAIKAGAPLKNDVICLFTDGEETGLMGARAFVAEHPWAKDVGVVFNFEARGNHGPSLMFETSNGNGWLIGKYAEAVPHPVTSSLLYEVYKHLPNESDLTVFKNAGYAGMNFAYIEGLPYYHSFADNVEQIDQDSLQHQGSNALSLTRHFGNVSLTNPMSGNNAVYFDLFGSYLIHYSYGLVLPLCVVIALLFGGLLGWGILKKRLSAAGLALGVSALLSAMLSSAIVVSLIWFLVKALHGGYSLILQGSTYNIGIYMLSFVALTIAITASLYIWFRSKTSVVNLFAGGLLWWVALMILTSVYVPGASYLFTLPLFFGLPALILLLTSKEPERPSMKRLAGLLCCSIPGLVLLIPIINLLLVALPPEFHGGLMILVVLLFGLLLPHFSLIAIPNKWLLPGLSVLACMIFVVAGTATSAFNKNRPKPNNIFYALNADTGKAVWASTDGRTDEWTEQFFIEGIKRGALSDYILSDYEGFISSPAPIVPEPAPDAALLSDSMTDGVRTLQVKVTSPRHAPFVSVELESPMGVIESSVEGRPLKSADPNAAHEDETPWQVFYYGPPPEGVEMTLKIKSGQPVKLKVRDQSFTLPQELTARLKPRPSYMIPTPYTFNPFGDATIMSKSFSF